MNAKQAKAIVFVCGLLLFAAAVTGLQAADYLAALAWAAVAVLAAVLYAGATDDDKADVKRAYKQGKDDACDEIIDHMKQAMDLLRIDPKQQAAIAKAMQVVLACKHSDMPLPDRIDVEVTTDQPDEDEEDEEEDDLQQVARQLAEGDIDDLREQGIIQYEAPLDIDGKPYTVTLTVEETTADDLTDTPDTSEQGAVNRKLGSDMGAAMTGGGLHFKDLSKADVSVNIVCHLLAQRYKCVVEASCAIGDESVTFHALPFHEKFPLTLPFADIVEQARLYVLTDCGSFEHLAEWGLIK